MATSADLTDNSGVAILDRVIMPDEGALTTSAARTLLALKFQEADKRRMNRLAAKARRGQLTDNERVLAEQYNLVSHMLALLQAKARHSLQRQSDGSRSA